MERELSIIRSSKQLPVEIDIRKILEQMGLDKERWPDEWLERPQQAVND